MKPLSQYAHIHCLGIGGIGLSAIAEILLARGYTVSGSDMKESDMTEKLRAAGATVCIGHSAENVEGADLVAKIAQKLLHGLGFILIDLAAQGIKGKFHVITTKKSEMRKNEIRCFFN